MKRILIFILFCYAMFSITHTIFEIHKEVQQQREDTENLIRIWRQQLDESAEFRRQMQEFMDRLNIGEFEATAYSPHDDRNGLNSWRPALASRSYTPRTRTGTIPKHGTVAVDPEVIPLGSRLWVEGYGFARAEDTGGAVKGRHVDLYVDSFDTAMEYGRQKKKVIWLKGGL